MVKINVADPKTGKTYKFERDIEPFIGKKIGDEINGVLIDDNLNGYVLKITGGSDNAGFPMNPSVHGIGRKQILMKEGVGYRPRHRERYHSIKRKKTVHGNTIDELIVQINCVVVKEGDKKLEDLFNKEENQKEGGEGQWVKNPMIY